jgi:hypothetical protein
MVSPSVPDWICLTFLVLLPGMTLARVFVFAKKNQGAIFRSLEENPGGAEYRDFGNDPVVSRIHSIEYSIHRLRAGSECNTIT